MGVLKVLVFGRNSIGQRPFLVKKFCLQRWFFKKNTKIQIMKSITRYFGYRIVEKKCIGNGGRHLIFGICCFGKIWGQKQSNVYKSGNKLSRYFRFTQERIKRNMDIHEKRNHIWRKEGIISAYSYANIL